MKHVSLRRQQSQPCRTFPSRILTCASRTWTATVAPTSSITTAAGLAIGYNLSGRDWTVPQTVGVVDSSQPLRFSDGRTQLCDVNGDRIQDLCSLRSGALSYWLGRGRGRFEPAEVATGVPSFDASDPWQLH